MPPISGMMHWHSLLARHVKTLQNSLSKGLKALDKAVAGQARTQLEPVLVRNIPKQPLHPLARIRQTQSRWYSTARRSLNSTIRNYTSSAGPAPKYDRSTYPKSNTGNYVRSFSGRAPFASTLRPNLTGGTLGRTAGGYTLGSGRAGGARYFSHGPASQAQVVQNVSQAMRAFFISGHKAQFDGVSPFSGEKRFKTVSTLQESTGRKMRSLPKATPGSWIDFQINPTITALTSLDGLVGYSNSASTTATDNHNTHINSDGLIDALSVDFSRALKDLAAVHNDLKRLSSLGDLLITYEGSSLRVHFPGCDSDTVERLCNELGIQRGLVSQDPAFDSFVGAEIALLFPMAPSTTSSSMSDSFDDGAEFFEKFPATKDHIVFEDMLTPDASEHYSVTSEHSGFEDILAENPWQHSSSGFQSVRSGSTLASDDGYSPLEYQGFEGIYRFIGELDSLDRRR